MIVTFVVDTMVIPDSDGEAYLTFANTSFTFQDLVEVTQSDPNFFYAIPFDEHLTSDEMYEKINEFMDLKDEGRIEEHPEVYKIVPT